MPANALIAARIAQPDMQGLGAESIVAALNAPDPSLPAVVERRPTRIGPGGVMAALGATEGALLLDTLTVLAAQSRPIHWALQIIQRGELDLSVPNARAQIDALAVAQVMTAAQAAALNALAEHARYPSWAEVNLARPANYREVVIAMGVHITTLGSAVRYTSPGGDWRLDVEPVGLGVRLELQPIATGGLTYASGINLDNLAVLIDAARADATARGINWSGN